MKSVLYILALLFSSSALAFTLDLVGGGNTTSMTASFTNSSTATLSPDSGTGAEYGALIEIGSGLFGLQTGALYISRQATLNVSLSGNTASVNGQWNSLQVPVLIRLHPLPFLALGAGVAYNMGQGNVSYTTKDPSNLLGFGAGTRSGSQSFDDFGQTKNDTVAVVSAEIDIPLAPMAHLLLRGDYQAGLTNIDNSGTMTQKVNTITYMGGLGFGF